MLWLVVGLTLLGFAMLAIEVIVPGLVVGTFGAMALVVAVGIAYWEFGFAFGSLTLAIVLLATSAGFIAWLYFFPRSSFGQRLTLHTAIGGAPAAVTASLVGEQGTALTHLRPSGTARIAGRRVDVVAEGGYVAMDQPVRVTAMDGMRVVVRAVEE